MYKNKKVIGFTGPSVFTDEVRTTIEDYFNAVPVYINNYKKEDLEYFVGQIDHLVLSGGSDIFPGTLGRPVTRDENYSKFNKRRDDAELFLIEKMLEKKGGILALCRGFQICGHYFGYELCPDISYGNILHGMAGDIKVNHEAGEFNHPVKVLPKYQKIYGFEEKFTNSYHHQALIYNKNQVNLQGLSIVGIADIDTSEKRNFEIIEMFESEQNLIVGSQFHSELYKFGDVPSNAVLNRFKEFIS